MFSVLSAQVMDYFDRGRFPQCVSGMEIRLHILFLNCGSFIFIIASGLEKF
jgi:hypothetical protein